MKKILVLFIFSISFLGIYAQDYFGSYTYSVPKIIEPYVEQLTTTDVVIRFGYDHNGGAQTDWILYFGTEYPPTTIYLQATKRPNTPYYSFTQPSVSPNTTYYYKFCATNYAGSVCSSVHSVTIPSTYSTPTVTTSAETLVSGTTYSIGGNVASDGGQAVTTRGICWNTTGSPNTSGELLSSGSGTGSFSITNTFLAGTTYYARAYAINSVGTSYGNQITFTTPSPSCVPPTVTIATISGITTTTANTSLTITSTGGCTVLASGIEWSIFSNFMNAVGSGPNTIGAYTMTDLSPNTTYYVRGYGGNSSGFGYSATQTFTTLPSCTLPTVTTASITGILATSATGGGNVTATGGCAVTARGVCWSTSTNPTIANSHTTDGSGTGSFTSNINSLAANTTYYVRAYATNSAGTSYGSQVSFTTLSLSLPTVAMTSIVDIRPTYAGAYGNVTSDGGSTITSRGFVWSSSDTSPQLGEPGVTSGVVSGTTGSYSAQISNLTCGTTYYINAYATNSNGTSYGTVISFTTTSQNLSSFNMYFSATSSCGSVDLTSSNTYASAVLLKSYLQCSPSATNANGPRVLIIQTGQTVYSFDSPCVVTLQNTYRVALVSGVYKIVHINSSGVIDLVE